MKTVSERNYIKTNNVSGIIETSNPLTHTTVPNTFSASSKNQEIPGNITKYEAININYKIRIFV